MADTTAPDHTVTLLSSEEIRIDWDGKYQILPLPRGRFVMIYKQRGDWYTLSLPIDIDLTDRFAGTILGTEI